MDGFIANLYEFWGLFNFGDFSNDMYQKSFYQTIFFVMIFTCLLIPVIYYYVVNHPRVNRWYHWFFFNLGTALVNFIAVWVISSDKIIEYYAQQGMNAPYDWTNYFFLALIASFWSVVCFFLFSFIMKWKSANAKHSPFV